MAKYAGTSATKQENLYPGYTDSSSANIAGDPAGYFTGVNKGGFGGLVNMLKGDPGAIKEAYDNMMATASGMTKDTRGYLANQEQQALKYFAPIQHMFNSAYGTQGIAGPQVPQGGMFSRMYGGR